MASPGKRQDGPADALALLRREHDRVRQLFQEFERVRGIEEEEEHLANLVDDICYELTLHAIVEEELFYPLLRAAGKDDDEMIDEAEVEHAGVRELVGQLETMYPGDEHFDATVAVLAEEVEHHMAREEGEIFEAARACGIDLAALARRIEARRRELDQDIDEGLDEGVPGAIDAMEPHAGMRLPPRAPD
ncbi:hemerythrin domain-containing protein [Massilia sp.]|uniref:hemerythrin domain-containing protein n=1 Tax=Massilia sp. TaxID=1882437 RepID=UPI0028AD26AC|nr:hemerythrin domain-containing protein [Massilia sp.]